VVGAAHHAFVTGFNTIALVSVAVAAVGSVAGYPPEPGAVVGGGAGFGTPTSH
jgi:hypothetical protein